MNKVDEGRARYEARHGCGPGAGASKPAARPARSRFVPIEDLTGDEIRALADIATADTDEERQAAEGRLKSLRETIDRRRRSR